VPAALVFVVMLTSACGEPSGSGELTPSSVNDMGGNGSALDSIVLTPEDVAPGVVISKTIPGGREVAGQVTLDLCKARYPSESLRTARLQVVFVDHQHRIGAGNEIVSYRPGGTRQAFRELRVAARHCPRTYRQGKSTISKVRFGPHDPLLGDRQLATSAVWRLRPHPGHIWSAAVYLFQGNYFSGVYSFDRSRQHAVRLALHLAEISAGKLGAIVGDA
jgi:hypothetical protein